MKYKFETRQYSLSNTIFYFYQKNIHPLPQNKEDVFLIAKVITRGLPLASLDFYADDKELDDHIPFVLSAIDLLRKGHYYIDLRNLELYDTMIDYKNPYLIPTKIFFWENFLTEFIKSSSLGYEWLNLIAKLFGIFKTYQITINEIKKL